ncbi:MAG: hypothetical protein AAF703_08470 [Cyanobacteria bacterium P01_D01_bin.105]
MTNILRFRVPNSTQASAPVTDITIGRNICLIVGLACMAGFIVNMLVATAPPALFDIGWRINFLQQAGERSIVFLFGAALFLYSQIAYSQIANRRIAKSFSLICLGVGVALMLSCVVVVRDSLVLQDVSVERISRQAAQIQSQMEERQNSSDLPEGVTIEQLQQASAQIITEAERLTSNARTDIARTGLASMGNLFIVGLALVGLGRCGLSSIRQMAQSNRGSAGLSLSVNKRSLDTY